MRLSRGGGGVLELRRPARGLLLAAVPTRVGRRGATRRAVCLVPLGSPLGSLLEEAEEVPEPGRLLGVRGAQQLVRRAGRAARRGVYQHHSGKGAKLKRREGHPVIGRDQKKQLRKHGHNLADGAGEEDLGAAWVARLPRQQQVGNLGAPVPRRAPRADPAPARLPALLPPRHERPPRVGRPHRARRRRGGPAARLPLAKPRRGAVLLVRRAAPAAAPAT
mmetsp:Transcript_64194/g.144807  ORF Transcript_64194/g.144807 Transcript_64194/m.144807 type:complete len:220 (-) Transcript_64194:16-675(-)